MLWLIVTLGTERPSPIRKMEIIQENIFYHSCSQYGKDTKDLCVTYELYVVLLVQKEVFDL